MISDSQTRVTVISASLPVAAEPIPYDVALRVTWIGLFNAPYERGVPRG